MLPYLSALENAIVFKGALQMSRFTLLYFYRRNLEYDGVNVSDSRLTKGP